MKTKSVVLSFLVFIFAFGMLMAGCGNSSSSSSSSSDKNASSSASSPDKNASSSASSNTSSPAPAEKAPEKPKSDFPNKNISFIVPTSPGGGFDVVSRMLAPYWEKYLPGDAKVVIENKPGGAWNIGLSGIYNAKPDGYTVGIINMPGNAANQILGKANFDLKKYVPLGRAADTVYVLAASQQSGIKSVDDLKKKDKVIVGTVSLSSTAGLTALISLNDMGLKVTPVPHDGSSEAILSAERGTVDLVQYPFASLKASIVDSHNLIPIVVYSDERLQELPDVPTIGEAGYPDLTDVVHLQRIIVATPGIPDDVAKILEDSLQKAFADPEFKQKMIDYDGAFHPTDGKKAGQIINNSFNVVEKYKDLLIQYSK